MRYNKNETNRYVMLYNVHCIISNTNLISEEVSLAKLAAVLITRINVSVF